MTRILFVLSILIIASLACEIQAGTATPPYESRQEGAGTIFSGFTTNTTSTPEIAVVTANRSLHARSGPSYAFKVVGYLYNADPITLTGNCIGMWVEIEWGSGTAWVNSRYTSANMTNVTCNAP